MATLQEGQYRRKIMDKLFNSISIYLGIIGGVIVSFLGGWDGLIITLVTLIILDYTTGVLKAIYSKELSSEIGIKGIIRKVLILIVIGVTVLIQNNLGIPAIREMVIMFFITNEGISLLENVSQMDIGIPKKLKDTLLQLREKGDE